MRDNANTSSGERKSLTDDLQDGFDVFNALTLLDNPLFLSDQKFGAGDGRLHYYLYNYRTPPIAGGIDDSANIDTTKMGGVGIVML